MRMYTLYEARGSRSSLHWPSDVTRTEKIYLYGTHRNSCPEFRLNCYIAGHFSSTLRTWSLQLAFDLPLRCVSMRAPKPARGTVYSCLCYYSRRKREKRKKYIRNCNERNAIHLSIPLDFQLVQPIQYKVENRVTRRLIRHLKDVLGRYS